jgi:uncharacterized protein YihD (DUF1040 family)
MRDPKRIARIVELLSEVWTKVPDWRLTQLVVNASDTRHDCGPVFYLEDDEFEQRLKALSLSIDRKVTVIPPKPGRKFE